MKKITFKAVVMAIAVMGLGFTACKKETIKPNSTSTNQDQQKFREEVVVKDKTGTISYTYELLSSDQKKIKEMKKELETTVLVPITSEEANQMAENATPNSEVSNVTVNLKINYTDAFFANYQQYKGQKIGFAVKSSSPEKVYQSMPAFYGVNDVTSTGVCSIVLFNQSYYFNLASFSYVRYCVFSEFRNGNNTSVYQAWTLYNFGAQTDESLDAWGTPVNNITRMNASTASWTMGGANEGKMDFHSSIWVP